MISKVHIPKNPILRKIVNCIGFIQFTPHDTIDQWFGLIPNATSNLTISLTDEPIQYNTNTGHLLLFSNFSSAATIKRTENLSFINIQFNPIGLYYLKSMPMEELQNTSLTMDMLFKKSECDKLHDKLKSYDSLAEKFNFIEQFILRHFNLNTLDDRLPYAFSLMKKQHLGMDDISDAVCLSTRGLRKLFTQRIGISPGYFKKIIRFNQAARQMVKEPTTSLTQIALSNNYYDQAHFIKDFKQFAGITPSLFSKRKAKSADFYNFTLDNLDSFDPMIKK